MSAPTIHAMRDAARRSTRTMVRPSRAFWLALIEALDDSAIPPDILSSEAELRAEVVRLAVAKAPDTDAALARWAEVFGFEVQP